MPCESCNTQFTVFKRKRLCTECRRYFCSHCLTKRNQNILCERCVIFTKRPLTREDLLNLKPKDLIFYLQSKNISTTGCVEKDELINLILAHINDNSMTSYDQNNDNDTTSSTINEETNNTNSFIDWRNTCQTFFNNFTGKMSNESGNDTNNQRQNPISREIPTYSESIHNDIARKEVATSTSNLYSTTNNVNNEETRQSSIDANKKTSQRPTNLVPNTIILARITPTNNTNFLSPIAPSEILSSTTSSVSSPINSLSSISSCGTPSQAINPNQNASSPISLSSSSQRQNDLGIHHKNIPDNNKIFKNVASDGNGSSCDCSDDEIITKYNIRQRSIATNICNNTNNNNNQSSSTLSSSFSSSKKANIEVKEPNTGVIDKNSPLSHQSDSTFEDQIAEPSGSTAQSRSNSRSLHDNNQIKSCNGSSGSSFEELGAVGGGGCGGGGGTGTCSTSSDNENWQMVNKIEIPQFSILSRKPEAVPPPPLITATTTGAIAKERTIAAVATTATTTTTTETERRREYNDWYKAGCPGPSRLFFENNRNDAFLSHSNISKFTDRETKSSINCPSDESKQLILCKLIENKPGRRITRRRSDSYIYRQNLNRTDQQDTKIFQQLDEESDEGEQEERKLRKRIKKCCKRCGKSKKSIECQVDKFRQQLESSSSSQLSPTKLKRELASFIEYLEQRAKSFDFSDESETNNEEGIEDIIGVDFLGNLQSEEEADNNSHLTSQELNHEEDLYTTLTVDNDGIYVYAPEEATSYQQHQRLRHDPRFINLIDYKSSSQLDDLSVKQLKEILMLNRVDFKGCCEKKELLDRVKRLWKELQACPEIEKIPADDLCKICMDAPIECVILECGHMATCTNCGKVLSECPICRQYIVRVVRFFKS